jgi:hypothetical protein
MTPAGALADILLRLGLIVFVLAVLFASGGMP